MRVSYWVSVLNTNSNLCSASVTRVLYAISCGIVPCYNGTRLQGSKFHSSDRLRRVKMTDGQVEYLQNLSDGWLHVSDFHISCIGFIYFRQVNGTFGQVIFTIHFARRTSAFNLKFRSLDCIQHCAWHHLGGDLKNVYELANLGTLKSSPLNKLHIFQCMVKIFCVESQRVPLKFHTKILPIHWKIRFLYNVENLPARMCFFFFLYIHSRDNRHTSFWSCNSTGEDFEWELQKYCQTSNITAP